MSEIIAALRQVTKIYPRTIAAREVSVEFFSGEVHALVGENGAGKTTLVKILTGTVQPNSGFVEVRGQKRRLTTPRVALMAGIGAVHQSGSLIDTLTVRENLDLGNFLTRRATQGSGHASSMLPPEISLNAYVRDLSPRQRQMVEIHRLLLQQVRVLVLDESTSNLSPQESSFVFAELNRLARLGYAVIIVSHKLPELLTYCNRFTVLKDGQVVGQLNREQPTVESIVRLMTRGESSSAVAPAGRAASAANSEVDVGKIPLIRFNHVCTDAESETEPIYDINLDVLRGEILGIAGRSGSGVATILSLLRGQRGSLTAGSIEWSKDSKDGPDGRIGFVPAERISKGLIGALTVGENLLLRRRNLIGRISSYTQVRKRQAFVNSLIKEFDVRPADPNRALATLSGGNAQRVLLAREMEYADSLLIVESPTAGLDIGSASFVRRVLRQKVKDGLSVVLASDDLDELVELSDRVIVLSGGRCTSELKGSELTSESLGIAMSRSEAGLTDIASRPGKAVNLR